MDYKRLFITASYGSQRTNETLLKSFETTQIRPSFHDFK